MKYQNFKGGFDTLRLFPEPMWSVTYDSDEPCTGKHCAQHNPKTHIVNTVPRKTQKKLPIRVPCSGEGCVLCEAFNL